MWKDSNGQWELGQSPVSVWAACIGLGIFFPFEGGGHKGGMVNPSVQIINRNNTLEK